MKFDSKIPEGDIHNKWDNYKKFSKPISASNRHKFKIIVVGSGLAGASASASLSELGFNVYCYCFHDSPRRAHSIAAQGGINAAKNYKNDSDSVYRLFYDTIKGGDFRSREANVYRLAQVSSSIIDHCVAQGVPFAREYSGLLSNRSFGGSLVSRTFYAKGQTGQQLLLGAYGSLNRQIASGNVKMISRTEVLDLVLVNGHAKGIIGRNLLTGNIFVDTADVIVLATGGYGSIFYLSTNAINCNVTAIFNAYERGALMANPCYTQIHPTCIPVSGKHQSKLTLMSESLRNDGRVWIPKKKRDTRMPSAIKDDERDYYLERKYPSYGNLAPRDISSRAAKHVCDENYGIGDSGLGVYLDFRDAILKLGRNNISAKYGNLFQMYEKITGEDPYKVPMHIYPASHYTMGGLWVDYELMSNIPGLFVVGEANFSDHGANRLGASALMQGLADGYFILPNTISSYLNMITTNSLLSINDSTCVEMKSLVEDKIDNLMSINGNISPHVFHKKLGSILWDYCGMERNEEGLTKALSEIASIKYDFHNDLRITGKVNSLNVVLEKALRVENFINFAELMCLDAISRNESCGAHFRTEHQTKEGEAKRNDAEYCNVQVWHYNGYKVKPKLYLEDLKFKSINLTTRSYK